MTTVRELPFDEWDRLVGLPIAANGLPSGDVTIMVAEDPNGEIVGVWTAGLVVMAEGLWVDEQYRKKRTLWDLFHQMQDNLRDKGVERLYSLVQDEATLKLAEHGGFSHIPGYFIGKEL